MTDFLLRFGFSGLFTSLLLALIALAVHRSGRAPAVAHLLWLLLLVKLVIPPMVALPVVPWPGAADTPPPAPAADPALPAMDGFAAAATATDLSGAIPSDADLASPNATPPPAVAPAATATSPLPAWLRAGAAGLWIAGSAGIIGWSLFSIGRFNRRLRAVTVPARPGVQRLAADVAAELGLRRVPIVYATPARLSPMVWWSGREVRIVVPTPLLEDTGADAPLRWILAHELAHLRRRDHLVRWLEWIACSLFWWNPLAWIARRNLRINEEICCDAMVLARCAPNPRTYAGALMQVVEYLATPAFRPPAVASPITGGGILERRFRMIISSDRSSRSPRWLMAAAVTAAIGLVPFGMASAQDYDALGKRLREAVQAGELSGEQARTMMQALRSDAESELAEDATRAKELRSHVGQVAEETRALLSAGRITERQAREMMLAARQAAELAVAAAPDAFAKAHDEMAKAMLQLRAAVDSGTIDQQEAARKMEMLQAELMQRELAMDDARAQYERAATVAAAEQAMRDAVESGNVDVAKAWEKMRAMEEEMRDATEQRVGQRQFMNDRQMDLRRALEEIRVLQKAGQITEAAAKERANRITEELVRLDPQGMTSEARARQDASAMRKKLLEEYVRSAEAMSRGQMEKAAADARMHELLLEYAKVADPRLAADLIRQYERAKAGQAEQAADPFAKARNMVERQAGRDARVARDRQSSRDARSARDSQSSRDAQSSSDSSSFRDARSARDARSGRDARSARDAQSARENRSNRRSAQSNDQARMQAYEADVKRIEGEIRNAVQSGWLTLAEAEAKMAQLRERAAQAKLKMKEAANGRTSGQSGR